jgi:hypothetical protein
VYHCHFYLISAKNQLNSAEHLDVFGELNRLEYLHLYGNRITSNQLNDQTFAGLASLRALYLQANCLDETDFPPRLFVNLASLKCLDLSENNFTRISGYEMFAPLQPHLRHIQIIKLKIADLKSFAIEDIRVRGTYLWPWRKMERNIYIYSDEDLINPQRYESDYEDFLVQFFDSPEIRRRLI